MSADRARLLSRPQSILREFLESASSGGIVLMGTAILALVVANSPWGPVYDGILHTYVGGLSILHWINDGLMAVFFLLVGLEIKREVLDGQLSTWSRRVLPGSAALGGMVGPALVYLAINMGAGGEPNGWAIPAATDIAFALGVLSLLGSRVPMSLRVFLTALAIIDDLGAVIIIALFYTSSLDAMMLAGAAGVTLLLVGMNRSGVTRLTPYLLLGAVLWFLVLKSGVHATLAGVVLALTIPLRASPAKPDDMKSPLHALEHGLHGWVTFLILPIFGFANAGVSFEGASLASLAEPVPLGIALGLLVGKQAGVFGACFLVTRAGWADLPPYATWRQMYGISLLTGVGFTMSLFIGLLAFPTSIELQTALKLGVLSGSVLSALAATLFLLSGSRGRSVPVDRASQEPEVTT